jgi:hypothetical protein
MFYQFNQNNTGGSFDVNDKVCHRLLIEAKSEKQSIKIAKKLGVYFNGCDKGIDCECCGDRWYYPDEIRFPKIYGELTFNNPEEYMQYLADNFAWTSPDSRIYYLDKNIVEINAK